MMSNQGLDSDLQTLSWTDAPAHIFKDPSLARAETRTHAIYRLQTYVAEKTQEMKGELFLHFMSEINQHLRDLINCGTPDQVLSGIFAINALLNVEYDTNDTIFVLQWAKNIGNAMHNTKSIELIKEASKCMGKLARIYQGKLPREFLGFQVRDSLEYLSLRPPIYFKCHMGVSVLVELFRNVPSLIELEHVEDFISLIGSALQSEDLDLHSEMVDAVRWMLRLIKFRVPEQRHKYYDKIYSVTQDVFNDTESTHYNLHGALLLLGVLFTETGRAFMLDKLVQLSTILLQLRNHHDPMIRNRIIQLIPNIAKFYPDMFALKYLDTWTRYLLDFTDENKPERTFALEAIGNMALYLGEQIKPQTKEIMAMLTTTFEKSSLNNDSSLVTPEIFLCLSSMADAVGSELEVYMHPILAHMLETEFTQTLVDTLAKFATTIPNLRVTIQRNLLNILSLILAKEPLAIVKPSQNFGSPTSNIASWTCLSPKISKLHSSHIITNVDGISPNNSMQGLLDREKSNSLSKSTSLLSSTFTAKSLTRNPIFPKSLDQYFDSGSSESNDGTDHPEFLQSLDSAATKAGDRLETSASSDVLISNFNKANHSGMVPTLATNQPINFSESKVKIKALATFLSSTPQYTTQMKEFDVSSNISSIKLVLALDTLSGFDFDSDITKHLIHRVVVNYLDNDNPIIRKTAVIACGKLLLQQGELQSLRGYSTQMTIKALDHLFGVALTDRDQDIRCAVLKALDMRFDTYLSQPHFLKLIFFLLYDNVNEIRELTIQTLGRLSSRNPGYIYPRVRSLLIELLNQLKNSDHIHTKESSAKLLGVTISTFPSLSRPYVEPLVKVFMSVAIQNLSVRLLTYTLIAIGDLSKVAGRELCVFLDDLLPIVIEAFQDQTSSSKSENALKTLSLIIENTGYAMEPFIKYPKLMDTILNKIKREDMPQMRCDLVRFLGILGALDPHKYKETQIAMIEADHKSGTQATSELIIKGTTINSPQYYSRVALSSLFKILKCSYGLQPSFQPMVIPAVITIFKDLGFKSVPYVKHFLPLFEQVMTTAVDSSFDIREFVFKQLIVLVSTIKYFTRSHQKQLLDICFKYWDQPKLIPHIVALIEQISLALGDEFNSCLVVIMPKILQTLQRDPTQNIHATTSLIRCLEVFGQHIDDYIHLIVPVLLNYLNIDSLNVAQHSQTSFSSSTTRFNLSNGNSSFSEQAILATLNCLFYLIENHDMCKFAVPITHNIINILTIPSSIIAEQCIQVLLRLMFKMNQDILVFIPMIQNTVNKLQIGHENFDQVVQCILDKKDIPSLIIKANEATFLKIKMSQLVHEDLSYDHQADNTTTDIDQFRTTTSPTTHSPEPNRLIQKNKPSTQYDTKNSIQIPGAFLQSWDTSRCFTKIDWTEWLRKLTIILLSESSSEAFRACAPLARIHQSLALELFNASFICYWNGLNNDQQMEVTQILKNILTSVTIPSEVIQILLNLAEFMEHGQYPLAIDNKILASLAMKCHAYAKALYYKESEFHSNQSSSLFEDIISINYQLQLHEAAQGMLKCAQDADGVVIQLSWYEKLRRWSTALKAYEKLQEAHPDDIEITLGRMRCMHDLGNWDSLTELCRKTWVNECNGPCKTEIANLALSAYLNLYSWDEMETYVGALSEQSLDGSFYRALLSVHKQDDEDSAKYIALARDLAATELTALIGESYNRAYSILARIQQLVELEEIAAYKRLKDDQQEKKDNILYIWKQRLQGVERNVEVWQSLLSLRSMVEPPKNNIHWWTKFANLVRKSDRPNKSRRILSYLLVGQNRELNPQETIPDIFPMVKYSYLNLLWQTPPTHDVAYIKMEQWVSNFSTNTHISSEDKARCYAKLARWQLREIGDNPSQEQIDKLISTAKIAIEKAPNWYRAWRVWVLVNYRFISHAEKNQSGANVDQYLLPAINGFIKANVLSPCNNLQDNLQLLTLWFKYGSRKDVEVAVMNGFEVISIDRWLSVIPQLMARIESPMRGVRQGVHRILTTLGCSHPQALLFPVMVAKQSPFPARVAAAHSIMTSLRSHSPDLVDETILVSVELVRVAILWKEKWYKSLDDASRYFYVEKKTGSMAMVLQRLNEMLERTPVTLSEQAFVRAYGRDLASAWEATKVFMKTGEASLINTAWDLYGRVFRTIKRQISQEFDKIHLKNVSPRLLAISNLSLSIPGTYEPGNPIVHINSFNPIFKIIPSKQQPRKIVINGSDGVDYGFLLKGHEDLRQDERVMQLFGLVNTFLAMDATTSKSDLSIRRFAVVPLSSDTGLIEWVPHCDTIHQLIKHYRKTHNIPLDAEQIIITHLVPKPDIMSYYKLTLIQKVEVFKAALDGTSPFDLERVFYLNSKGSEDWLERRTTYTRSLAVISMIGYILGLGDRHPNNFLVSRSSGKILHIDFGDCFEVAMRRERYAEKVPFRLTRMMVAAMELCGIHGTFRLTCEVVMRVLRANADSIAAVLESFVYDPLINWRLITVPLDPSPYHSSKSGVASDNAFNINNSMIDEYRLDSQESYSPVTSQSSRRIDYAAQEAITTEMHEELNAKSLKAIQRVSDKLNGTDFEGKGPLDEATQLDLLIAQASSLENLSSAFLGFCGYW